MNDTNIQELIDAIYEFRDWGVPRTRAKDGYRPMDHEMYYKMLVAFNKFEASRGIDATMSTMTDKIKL